MQDLALEDLALDDLDQQLAATLEKHGVVGGAWVLIGPSGQQHLGFYGHTDRSRGTPVDAATRFRVGSVSKTLTALLAVCLHDQGRIDIDQPVRPLLPDGVVSNPWAASDPITLAQLLEHTAGLRGSSYRDYATEMPNATTAQFLQHTGELRVRWRPGAFFSYSNTGYGLAGAVLEAATGEAFDTLMQREVFEPLQIASGSFGAGGDAYESIATGHDARGYAQPPWAMPMRPAGGLVVAPADLAKVVRVFLDRGLLPGGGTFLPEALIDRTERAENSLIAAAGARPQADGLGQFGYVIGGRLYRGHWGKTSGFLTNFGYLPEHGGGFVLAINSDARGAMAECRAIIDRCLTQRLPLPPRPAIADAPAAADAVGSYVNATHDMPLRDWLFRAIDQKRIWVAADGRLLVRSAGPHGGSTDTYRPAAGGGLIADSVPVATAALVRERGATYWVDGDAYQKVTAVEATLRRWGLVAALFAAAATLLAQPAAWLYRRLRPSVGPTAGGLASACGIAGCSAAAALLAVAFLFTRYGLLGSAADLRLLGRPSWVSIGLAVGSLVFVLAALLGAALALVLAWRSPSVAAAARLLVLLPGAGLAALWLASGWAPLRTWL
ncbi:MAG: serine hydrolase domain-containing protein [Planctomycetota bacterium]